MNYEDRIDRVQQWVNHLRQAKPANRLQLLENLRIEVLLAVDEVAS